MQNLSPVRPALNSARGKHLTGKLSDLGRRPLHEFLDKLVSKHPVVSDDIMELLEQYSQIDVEFIRAARLNEWPRVLVVVPNDIKCGSASRNDIMRQSLAPRHDPDGGRAA